MKILEIVIYSIYMLEKQFDMARKLFLKLILMQNIDQPMFAEVKLDGLLMLAELARAKDELDECIYWCKEFIKVNDTFRGPYLSIANIYNSCGMFNQAKELIKLMDQKCVRHYSWVEKSADWSYTKEAILAESQINLGEYEEALKNINVVLEHEPNNIEYLKLKVACLEKIYQG